jgi:hypothetical protein
MPNGVCMVWICHLEKLLEVIDRLSCLALGIALDGSDVFLVGVIHCLVIVVVVAITGGNDAPLGAPLLHLLAVFGASLSTPISSFGRCPMAATGDRLPIVLDENGLTDSSLEACKVALSSSSFMVFG